MRLPDHVVVTGGASGIGLAVVMALIDEGVSVTVIDSAGEAIADAEDRLEGEIVLFLCADVTDEEDVIDAFDAAVERFGPVTGLVNAANLLRLAPVSGTDADLFRQVVDINLAGTFISCRAALDCRGDTLSIVNLSSVSALRASTGRAAYGASKAGVISLSQVFAVEFAGKSVRVNVVAPGPINTESAALQHGAAERAHWTRRVPQNRYGQPEEVSDAILYLLSDASSFVTGQVLAVDGGFSVAGLPDPDPEPEPW